jgi:glycerol-3-phosphate O-acyltransferase
MGRFKRYGYAAVSFGAPILVDDLVRDNPELIAGTFEERKASMKRLADQIMESISAALPITPVPVVARVFAGNECALTESGIIDAVRDFRERSSARVWLTGEQTAEEIWEAAKRLLVLRHLIEETAEGWRWNPEEILLRDYYANALVPYGRVVRSQ